MSTWFITGCSTGLGRALAEAVLESGQNVVATARHVAAVEDLAKEYPDTALAVPLDVTQSAQVPEAVQAAQDRFGAVDVLVNNAGYGYRTAVEEGDDADVQELRPLGISVTVIEPGAFRTDFAGRSLHQSATPIADYADTAGKRRKEHDTAHGNQPNDPARGARAMIAAVEADDTPSLLMLGQDAVTAFRAAAAAELAQIEEWEATSLSTAFDS